MWPATGKLRNSAFGMIGCAIPRPGIAEGLPTWLAAAGSREYARRSAVPVPLRIARGHGRVARWRSGGLARIAARRAAPQGTLEIPEEGGLSRPHGGMHNNRRH